MQYADKILTSRSVFTGLTELPFDGGVAVSGHHILSVFKGDVPKQLIGGRTEIYDFGHKLIMPSFVDAHTHMSLAAASISTHVCTAIENSVSPKNCVEIMKAFEKEHPFEERLMGIGWYPACWHDVPLPDSSLLDEAFPDKAVYLLCGDLHTAWVNQKALEELEITADTVPEYGSIRLDKNGNPDGILFEMDLVIPIFTKMTDYPIESLTRMFGNFFRKANQYGITALSDMTPAKLSRPFLQYMENLSRLSETETFTVRLHMYSNLGTTGDYTAEKSLAAKYHSELFQYSGLKQMIDGVTSTYTGLLLEPYSDRPKMTCSANYPKETFLKCTAAAQKAGLGVRFHSIGDAAVRWALDCFEYANKEAENENNRRKLPNTVEHIESIHPNDLKRFKELGVIASVQPYHLTFDHNEKISRIGLKRCRYEWPFKSLAKNGAVLAFGTDAPVIGMDPFANIHAAVTRCDDMNHPTGANPQEAVSLSETLKAYTRGAALAYGRTDIGTLQEGNLADIIVLNCNLFEIPPEQLKDCFVDLTMFNGRIVFDRGLNNIGF